MNIGAYISIHLCTERYAFARRDMLKLCDTHTHVCRYIYSLMKGIDDDYDSGEEKKRQKNEKSSFTPFISTR